LPDSVRYNGEWTPIFWLLGCPVDPTVVRTTATLQTYDGAIVIERNDTAEMLVVLDDNTWITFPENSSSIAQIVDTSTLSNNRQVTFYIQRYQHGYIFDPSNESETRVLLDSDRLDSH
jgi:hypothetical protein